jgi:hypothetical protein
MLSTVSMSTTTEPRTLTEHAVQKLGTINQCSQMSRRWSWVQLLATEHHTLVATCITGEVLGIQLNERLDSIGSHNFRTERNLVHLAERQIQSISVIAKQNQKIIHSRIGEPVRSNQLIKVLIENLDSRGMGASTPRVKRLHSIWW